MFYIVFKNDRRIEPVVDDLFPAGPVAVETSRFRWPQFKGIVWPEPFADIGFRLFAAHLLPFDGQHDMRVQWQHVYRRFYLRQTRLSAIQVSNHAYDFQGAVRVYR